MNLMQLTQATFKRLIDGVAWRVHNRRKRLHRQRAAAWNVEIMRILNTTIAESGPYVRSGPFKGMMYWPLGSPGYAMGGQASSLLGTYECELGEVLEEFIGGGHEHIIDIGCAEGYYAVGLALRCPRAHVYAFDIEPKARHLCQALAVANGVADRVTVLGECTPERLQQLTSVRSLVVSDCEGYEVDLLRVDLVPNLAHCDLIVELHEFLRPGLTQALLPRFTTTHHLRTIDTEARDPARFQDLDFLSLEDRAVALDEWRPCPMQWAVMKAREVTACRSR
jgi:SAM-dependent methyltransferase